jgi:DNA-binding NarL/FixJ family response regulator
MEEKSNDKSKLVQMRFQPKTMDRIERLRELTENDNRTQIISSSIQLTEELLSSIKDGAKIYIEKPDGTKETIKIVGF